MVPPREPQPAYHAGLRVVKRQHEAEHELLHLEIDYEKKPYIPYTAPPIFVRENLLVARHSSSTAPTIAIGLSVRSVASSSAIAAVEETSPVVDGEEEGAS